ncbi:hypothetical protein N0V90_003945 [Kalmusia sp. IMI 367209]|nr:hypothetical protein N0V90_003945 [Kalmusia sp. IMI 367209]
MFLGSPSDAGATQEIVSFVRNKLPYKEGIHTDYNNWRESGHNAWGLQYVDKIIQTDPIRKGPKASTFTSRPWTFDGLKFNLPDIPSLELSSFLSQTETDGLLVLKDGIVVYEYYDQTNTQTSIHATFSTLKSVIGLLCGILVEQGTLDREVLVSTYVPEIEGSAYINVTVRQLLDMCLGVNHDDASLEYCSATGFYPVKLGKQSIDLHTYIPTIRSPPPVPIDGLDGPHYEYISANADLAGWVVERASGKRIAEVLSESIWQPMGAESDAYVTIDSNGNARAAAGNCATVRDMARLSQIIV